MKTTASRRNEESPEETAARHIRSKISSSARAAARVTPQVGDGEVEVRIDAFGFQDATHATDVLTEFMAGIVKVDVQQGVVFESVPGVTKLMYDVGTSFYEDEG